MWLIYFILGGLIVAYIVLSIVIGGISYIQTKDLDLSLSFCIHKTVPTNNLKLTPALTILLNVYNIVWRAVIYLGMFVLATDFITLLIGR